MDDHDIWDANSLIHMHVSLVLRSVTGVTVLSLVLCDKEVALI